MNFEEYWNKSVELSRASGECHRALLGFLEKNRHPSSIHDPEYHRLRDEYARSFKEWIEFSERHSASDIESAG